MFKESEHPRDKDGKFTDGNGSAAKREEAERIYNSELPKVPTLATANLTKQEWAMFYERIGKIKKEGHYVPKTAKGEMLIQIETKDSNVLVVAFGNYKNPRIKRAFRFARNDEMYKIIETLEDI